MAIIVEEEKNKIGLVSILTWAAVLVIIGVTVYYIFFAKPEIIEVAVPSNFKNITPLSQIKLNPEDVINNPVFQSLKQYVSSPKVQSVGRANPFLPF